MFYSMYGTFYGVQLLTMYCSCFSVINWYFITFSALA